MATPTSPGNVLFLANSGKNYIDALLIGTKWRGTTGSATKLTYSFGRYASSWYAKDYGKGEPWTGFAPLTKVQKKAAQKAFAAWSEIANLKFSKVTDSRNVAGEIRLARSSKPPGAWAYTPQATEEAGDIWFSHDNIYNTAKKGTYGYYSFLHEIGHALGLKHPHESNGSGVRASILNDRIAYSVMSYRSYLGQPLSGGSSGTDFYPTTPMLHDIAAMQYLYGANRKTRAGNTVYKWGKNQQIFQTIWDGGGKDTIDWSNQWRSAKINLQAGQWSELGPKYRNGKNWQSKTLAIAYGVRIENAIGGTGNDTIEGNRGKNLLRGKAGRDYLYGLGGRDRLYGGANDDWLWGNRGKDRLDGGRGRDYLYGGAGKDSLRGGRGRDYLDGGAGKDWLSGGGGNDTYLVDHKGDVVTELAQRGTDTVRASVSYKLGKNLEKLFLTGKAKKGRGNGLDNHIHGNAARNTLYGRGGDDSLYGNGGKDILTGQRGDDWLFGGYGGDTLKGNGGKDYLSGGWGDDRLVGGSGKDTLIGGAGADIFVFGSPGQGIDRITDFIDNEGDRLEISRAGFGVSSIRQFRYDSDTGNLFFRGIQFAQLQTFFSAADFALKDDLVLV